MALSYYFGQWLIQQLVLPYKSCTVVQAVINVYRRIALPVDVNSKLVILIIDLTKTYF